MEYKYPQVTGGYRWNMVQRILNEVGLKPTMTGDVPEGDTMKTVVSFNRALTENEKAVLDTVMASNPTLPPANSGTVLKIKDIWNKLNDFKTATGQEFKLYYSESVLGSGNVDQIELHASKTFTTQERNKVLAEYAKLIT
jgi:hypothetical protein